MKSKKPRRLNGDGSLYLRGRLYWLSYLHPDGTRRTESSGTDRQQVALRLLRKRVGAGANGLPVIVRAEQLTFHDAAQAVIDDFVANKKKSLAVVKRRITKHLVPVFGTKRLASITSADITAYIARRQTDTIVSRKAHGTVPAVTHPVSNAEINRELQILKRIFNLAVQSGRLAIKPAIKMLRESPARSGFFEADQLASVLAHLPEDIQPVIKFASITGWRIASEVLPLEWRNVDFAAGEVRLDAGVTKNGEGRVFPFTDSLRDVLEAQHVEHERLKKAGQICPLVFWRMLADHRGGEKKPTAITSFTVAWKIACRAAGCPGKIPHDLRRTAVRSFVRAGISETVAMELSGHKTPSVFRRYNITSPGDLRDAAARLNVPRLAPAQQSHA
jgi:integrase